MKKTPTLFDRDWSGDKSRVVNVPNPECRWVFDGEGWPTRKIDGTCCLVKDGALYKRRELRAGEAEPAGFTLADRDDTTQKVMGWVPVGGGPEDRWHREAFERGPFRDGTYELVGPKIQGNPEGQDQHRLMRHDELAYDTDVPRDFDGLRDWLAGRDIEGLVFHHDDGRMAKIKLRDFGIKRQSDPSVAA